MIFISDADFSRQTESTFTILSGVTIGAGAGVGAGAGAGAGTGAGAGAGSTTTGSDVSGAGCSATGVCACVAATGGLSPTCSPGEAGTSAAILIQPAPEPPTLQKIHQSNEEF